MGALTLAIPHAAEIDETALLLLVIGATAIGVGLYVRAEQVSQWQVHVVVGVGTVMVALANLAVGMTLLYPLLFSWTGIYAFYFFPIREALGQLALIGAAYAVVLGIQDAPALRWLLAVGTPAVTGLLIARLLGGLRREAGAAEARTRELRESESRTRLLLDTAPDAFVAIEGKEGTVTGWNTAAERLFGYSAAEVMGRPLRELIFPADGVEAHDQRRGELMEGREPVKVVHLELELMRKDGTTFPADETLTRVTVGDDVMLSGFIRDVSERRRRQKEREALMREQAARAEAERMTALVSGMQLLVDATLAHRTTDDILPDLVDRVRSVLEADGATIYLAEEDRLVLRASTAGSESADAAEPVRFGEGFAGRVAATREALLSQDPEADLEDPGLRDLELDSLIGMPLLAEGEVTGVLVVCAAAPRRFTADDMAVLGLAADRVALGIGRTRVYEREHRIAETLQRSLLPDRLPDLPGLAVAARYLPAAAEAEVGGDWYDVIPIPGGRVGMVMGDVAGKGLAAASMVGRLRSALRAYALEGHNPATAIEQLNRLLWTEAEDSQMATLLYAIVDPGANAISWVNAGHMPPLLVQAGGQPEFLTGARSVPLGVLPFPTFEQVDAQMGSGSAVVLYTDGLIERPGTIIDEGMERLAQVIDGVGPDPEALCDHLLARLVPGGGAADDVALLALRNVPMTDRIHSEFAAAPEALSSMRGLLRRWLRHAGADDQEVAEIVTACGEAATNAIEHAGAGGDVPFEVAGLLEGQRVDVTVRDRGAWRSPRDGDRGRGLSLMKALMDTVEVSPGPDGTRVRLGRELSREGDA
ncbi:MAG TPA: SpoIIE family protein phosphatase [Thermoleophilaceae bacterium]|nr:SpoIIE family protein phosphatase [Thermoleophilaceae bacterium]